jgi:class 3 adenylate cyclase/tetratricopeptide (TPR) repeat protein
MDFYSLLDDVLELLRGRGRVTYRALKRQFHLDDDVLDDLKEELIKAQRVAVDENGDVLVWVGDVNSTPAPTPPSPQPVQMPLAEVDRAFPIESPAAEPPTVEAERRQLTVLFCDLVDSTALSSQLDPEDWREVVRAYQEVCAKVTTRYEGHIAQYLGDGLLVYFGYPQAHEDDAHRAVRSGLGIVEAMAQLNTRLELERGVQLAVRLGIHTGLVVVGDVGGGTRQEQLALGDTPNIAARLQGLAAPNTVVITGATFQLLGGFFACQPLGTPPLKGVAQPLAIYRVMYESMARSRLEVVGRTGLTPLVGREQELGLLRERWALVKEGLGQVVLLSGEAGIGKSRLVEVLKEEVAAEPQAWLTPCQCSPYYQSTALYPLIDLLDRVVLCFEREESPQQKLAKLEGFVVQYGLPLAEAVPLFAALLSLPLMADYVSLTTSPEQQRQRTLHALLTILLRIAAQQPVLLIMEDLHWVDPSTLELLSLLVDQGPTARILALFTCRPDFRPPWTGRSHLTQVTLPRLPPRQAAELSRWAAHGKTLPAEVVEQVVAKTDGVPLFLEELTKMVVESGLLREVDGRYELTGTLPPLAIPATLHDSLMARLDRLATVKTVAQLGATIGRTFAYELLRAVAPLDEATLQRGLRQLVEAELVYQRGAAAQATYFFKHALIQDAAYQSLLKSTRQQYHQRIAQVLAAQFPETAETQPELLAHHYTEAGLHEQAIPCWQQAGQRAVAHSAYREAVVCYEQALQALDQLPAGRERHAEAIELRFQLRNVLLPLGEQERILGHLRTAATLAEAVQDRHHLGWVTTYMTSCFYNMVQPENAVSTGQRALTMAMSVGDVALQIQAAYNLGLAHHLLGDYRQAVELLSRNVASLEGGLARERFGLPYLPSVFSRTWLVWCLAELGAFTEGRVISQEAIQIAEAIEQPWDLLAAYRGLGLLSLSQGEIQAAIPCFERCLGLCREWDISGWFAILASQLGYTYALCGRMSEALPLLEQATGQVPSKRSVYHSRLLGYLGEAYLLDGRLDEALPLAVSALESSVARKERGFQAYALRLVGEIAARHGGPDVDEAESNYQEALALAKALGMCPLQAHCHLGLGTLYATIGCREQAHPELFRAIELYRAMDMTFWLPQAEATLAQVEGR